MKDKKVKNVSKLIWIPRILALATILIIGSLTLEGFTMGAGFFSDFKNLFMHLVPSVVILGMLLIFWKDPMKSGFGMFLAAMGFTGYYRTYENASSFILLTVIPALAAVLFFYSFVKQDRAEYREMQERMAKAEEEKQKLVNQPVKLSAKQKAKLKAKQKEMQDS